MPIVNIDLRQFSGEETGLEPDDGSAWFWPYRPYIEDEALVSREILKVKTVDGIAAPVLPETPLTEVVWVQLRGVKGAGTPWLVQIPATECNLFDLVHIDPDSLDPEAVPSPYWLTYMNDAIADAIDGILDGAPGAMDTLAELAAALGDDPNFATTIITSLGEKVDQATYASAIAAINTAVGLKADDAATTAALATKVNSATYTAGLALKADTTALTAEADARVAADALKADANAAGREVLAVSDYDKMRPWFAALANRRNQPVNIVMFGDSGPEGYQAPTFADTLPQQLGAIMQDRFSVPGGQSGRGFIGMQSDLVNLPFWPQAYTGGGMAAVGYGVNFRTYLMSGAGQKFVQTVPDGGITSFDIHFYDYAVGTNTGYYIIDGGTPEEFDVTGGAFLEPKTLHFDEPVVSTLEVGWVAGAFYASGALEYNGGGPDDTVGVLVHNAALSGSMVSDWNTAAVANQWPDAMAMLEPDVAILQIGANDARISGGNKTAATFEADLTYLLTAFDTFVGTCPIVLSMAYSIGDSGLREPWANYVAAARNVAAARTDTIVVDHSARMYASDVADPDDLYNPASPGHGSAKGYALMAETLAAAISPR